MDRKKNEPEQKKRTDEKLRKASDAVYYEMWMFNEMVKSLLTQPPQPGNPQYNALVESFVQHTRNLIEFFYPPSNVHSDTIIVTHFFSDQNKWKKDIPDWLDDVKTRAHKLLAHLTYDRIKYDKGWEYNEIREIREHLNSLFAEFLKIVPQDRIGNKLKNYKVPPANVIEPPNVVASTGTACLPEVGVSKKTFSNDCPAR
jgi:hypothetical protein